MTIARIDVAKKHAFLEKEGFLFGNLPQILICKDKSFYRYNGLSADHLLLQLNRILTPLVHLSSEEEVDEFFIFEEMWQKDYSTKFFKSGGGSEAVGPAVNEYY